MTEFDLLQTYVGVPADGFQQDGRRGGDEFETTELAPPEERLLEKVENCPLIETPEQTSKAKTLNLRHDLTDCKGCLRELPYREPNADANAPNTVVKEVMRAGGGQSCLSSPLYGRLVPPGCLGIYRDNGVIKAVGQGRWILLKPNTHWIVTNQSLNVEFIRHKNLMIIRVPEAKVGLIRENGNPFFLAPGTHVFTSGLVDFIGIQDQSKAYLFNHPYHIIRVPRGQYAKVWVSNDEGGISPRLLQEGLHMTNDNQFRFEDMVYVNQSLISHGSVHIIQVTKGKVAKIIHENKPRLLGSGTHSIEAVNFEYCGESFLTDKLITHRTITIVRVGWGEIGVAWNRNQPMFIDKAGLYAFDSPDFTFVKHEDANSRVVELGAKKIIMVFTGEVGISYDHGKLVLLNNGRHLIDSANHIFHGFLSTQQKSIRLVTMTDKDKRALKAGKFKERDSQYELQTGHSHFDTHIGDLMICETKDLVKVGVRADVFFSIVDPEKTVLRIPVSEIDDMVRETAIATLTNIIRSTALNQIAQSKQPSAISNKGSLDLMTLETESSTTLFFDKAHDEFLSKLHDDFVDRYGIEISNIRIESFKIMDDELASSISKQAVVTAKTENELANLQGRTEIATAEQKRHADVLNIKAEAEARALKTETDAEYSRMIEKSKAQAESSRIEVEQKAKAEADALVMKAKAEAEAIRLVAEAESERAEMLSKTLLGGQTALLKIYSEIVNNASKGVEKVIYCDPSLIQNGNIFMIPNVGNLNGDLDALNKISTMTVPTTGSVPKT